MLLVLSAHSLVSIMAVYCRVSVYLWVFKISCVLFLPYSMYTLHMESGHHKSDQCINCKEHIPPSLYSCNHPISDTEDSESSVSERADSFIAAAECLHDLTRKDRIHVTEHDKLGCKTPSCSPQLTVNYPVSVAIPTAREDSLSMADVNYQMLVGPAGPGSTMPAELSIASSDPHPHTEHQVFSIPSQESSCGGHEHSLLVVGKLHICQ